MPAPDPLAAEPLLELDRISVVRGGRLVLREISLRIDAGECVAIVGPNGCGKSTLLKLLTRELYPLPGPGAMRVFGRERWHVRDLRRALGIVTNDLGEALAGAGSALDVVTSGFFATHGLTGADGVDETMRERARAALVRLGVDGVADRAVATLSSGQARRVLIARALVREPRTLVFDEPTAALDVRARRDFLLTLRELCASGTGVLLVTHDFAEIIPAIGRTIFMREGALVADGPRAAMLRADRLAELFEVDLAACLGCGALV